MPDFALDPRLEADTLPIADLALCMLRLSKDARFPWLILAPKRVDIVEIIDLVLQLVAPQALELFGDDIDGFLKLFETVPIAFEQAHRERTHRFR